LRNLLTFILLLLLLFSFNPAFSQIVEDDSLLLEQLSVDDLDTVMRQNVVKINTASRSTKDIGDLPFTSYVITKKDIQENNYRTLTDVLKNIPGVRVSQPGSSKTGETFTINGLLGNYYTKILINGIPINPSGAAGMPIGAQLPIKQAERIEIITNPSSAIYGADAMGGVINIITEQNQKRGIYGNAIFSIGDYGYNEMNLLLGGRVGKDRNILKYNFFANYSAHSDLNIKKNYKDLYNLNNYPHIDTTGLSKNPLFEGTAEDPFLGNMPSRYSMYGIGVEYKDLKFSIFSMRRLDYSSTGNLPYYSSYQLPDTYWGEQITRYSLSFNKAFRKINIQTNLSYLRYRMENGSSELSVNSALYFENGLSFTYGASDDISLDQLFNFNVSEHSRIALGGDFTYSGNLPIYQLLRRPFTSNSYRAFSKSLLSNKSGYYELSEVELAVLNKLYDGNYEDLSPFTFYKYGLFAQYDYSTEKLNMLFDLRYDNHSIYGPTLSPRASALYRITSKFMVKGEYSIAFKSPSSYYKYSSFARRKGSVSYFPFPNSQLEYEQLESVELSFIYMPSKKYSFEILSNFYKRSNEIVFSLRNPDLDYPDLIHYGYYGYVNNRGHGSTNFLVQGNIRMKDIVPSIKLNVDFSVTYQERKETTNPELLRYDNYRIQPSLMFQSLVKLNLTTNIQLIMAFYANNKYDNVYYEFYSEVYPGDDLTTKLLNTDNSAFWSDMSLNYYSNNNFTFYARVKNVFNTSFSGIQTADLFKGLYCMPQTGRTVEFGVSFKMF
jgi:outer membrane receptor for ferrienterochelin and colicin